MRVARIFYYPIRSCSGVEMIDAFLDTSGIVDDHLLTLVDANSRSISQRECPKLAEIQPSLKYDVLTVRAPGVEPLHHRVTDVGESRPISFWADRPDVVDQGQVPADWFTRVLGFPCWLALAADHEDKGNLQLY